ncbi:type II secretion system major pseudopilin GspG [Pseudoxanthomonas sp. CAU 1598]|uniref:Type II secretion system core protein G n=2 Tax=Pseudomarimonas arenosa TaxID=2774145 RepID=A0AAW3ZMM7_9GAMM|nr:type II secretion system major pseudopilin GspG [Pseudomarimonas arenosa]
MVSASLAVQRRALGSAQRGFTLIEILVVVVIIGILVAVVAPNFMGEPDKARVTRAKQDIDAIATALNMYRLDNFAYPSTDQGLQALVSAPGGSPPAPNWRQGGYLPRLPKDPWDNEYRYLSPGQRGEIDIYSLGADGQPGGEGIAADIGNWGN